MTKDEAIELLDAMREHRDMFPRHVTLELIEMEEPVLDREDRPIASKMTWGVGVRDNERDMRINLLTPANVDQFMRDYIAQLTKARGR